MLDKKLEAAFNDQINAEMYSAYLYHSMSAWFAQKQLPGFAQWMWVQGLEEMTHAKRFYDHILERGGRVILQTIEQPPHEFESILKVFEATLEHEQYITSRIHNLMKMAHELNDYPSFSMLQWFVDEQVEEESTAEDMLGKVKLIGENQGGLYMLEKELSARAFTPPADMQLG